MKNSILTIFLFLLLVGNFCFGQNSWAVLLPDYGTPIKMIKSIDGNYLLLASKTIDYHIILYKYNSLGELIWRQEMDRFYAKDICQLNSGLILVSGSKNSIPFLVKLGNGGEILKEQDFPDLAYWSSFNNINQLRQNQIISFYGGNKTGFVDNYCLINLDLGIVKIDSSLKKVTYNQFLKTMDNGYALTGCSTESCLYKIYDKNLNLVREKEYSFAALLFKETNDGFIIHRYYNPYANDDGLLKLDCNLDSLWRVPFSHYYIYEYKISKPDEMAVCEDGGFVMSGSYSTIIMNRTVTYMIKTDSLGNPVFFRDFWNYSPEFTKGILEDSDGGFLLLQFYYDNDYTSTFLVHTNIDGTININEGKYKKQAEMEIFPNPADDHINLLFPEPMRGIIDIEFYGLDGSLKGIQQISYSEPINLDINDLKKGIYIIHAVNNKIQYNRMFMKK